MLFAMTWFETLTHFNPTERELDLSFAVYNPTEYCLGFVVYKMILTEIFQLNSNQNLMQTRQTSTTDQNANNANTYSA